ncbi:hypothetical protein [Schaalia vaccimaxillae]|uniref:hypothetical protein n=1 Tax=Schaalia vaccimaxillae TaxID=183916 RepID=UPI0003B61B67|nr:hypothetical protein [Schaalia vaccimaxillae]
MTQLLACTTIIDGSGPHDYTVPEGTTVAGLMAMIEVDLSQGAINLTTPNGRAVAAGAVIGRDLPSGSIIALSGRKESRRIASQAAHRNAFPWMRRVLSGIVLLTALIIAEGAVLVAPFFTSWAPPGPLRWATGLVCALVCVWAITIKRVRQMPWLVISLSLLFGLTALAIIPPTSEFATVAAPLATFWWALIGSIVAWNIYGFVVASTLSWIWAVIVAVSTIRALLEIEFADLSPIFLAVCVLSISLAPTLALRIPETQLLDMPLVATTAGSLRGPTPHPPSKITMPRVLRTMDEATSRTQTILIALTVVILTCIPSVCQMMDSQTWKGRAALAVLVLSCVALLICGRGQRDVSSRILPRIAAVAIGIGALTSPPVITTIGVPLTVAILLSTGLISLSAVVITSRKGPAALTGRILDILEAFSLIFILPIAVYATGAFDFIRQVAS